MTQPRKRSARSTGSSDRTSSEPAHKSTRSSAQRRGSRPSPAQLAHAAVEQLTEISGAEAESISGLERTEDGWLVRVEVVEVHRIPDATSIMASYQVDIDDDGVLQSYRRAHRYYRNQAGEV